METEGLPPSPPLPPLPPPTTFDATHSTFVAPEAHGSVEDIAADPSLHADADYSVEEEMIQTAEGDSILGADAVENVAEEQNLGGEPSTSSPPAVLSDELRDQIVRQVEYYFSDANLPTDKFMLKFVKKNKNGFVPLAVIASFRRMRKLVHDLSLVEAALRTSSQLVVSADGKSVKRLHPLTTTEITDTKPQTVLVENLPQDCSSDNIRRIFGAHGNIVKITLHDPNSVDESTTSRKSDFVISSKVHALIEYVTVEAAEGAVASLNDEKNWRSGMHVEMLLKRMGKYGLVQKGQKGTVPEKKIPVQAVDSVDGTKIKSTEHHDEMTKEEDGEQLKGARKSRYRRGHSQPNANGHGHGGLPPGSKGEHVSKPIQGPKMPDGTRGFTMGRGRPAISDLKPNQHYV